jgi:PAS domain S-box-containing protein
MRRMSRLAGKTDGTFLAFFEVAPDAMVCVAADGRIALVNARAVQLFGYRREELAGQPVEMLMPDAARTVHAQHRAGYMADPRLRPMGADRELVGRRRDGTTFPAEISLAAIDTAGGMLVTATVRDMTGRLEDQAERDHLRSEVERGRLEHQRQQSLRLDSLGQLAGGVAHDFNNLLGVISNYAAFISEEVAKQPPDIEWQAVREDIEQVERAAQRAAGLTRQLLSFARRETLQPRVFCVNELIRDLRQLLVRTLGERAELVIRLASHLNSVLADRGQIEHVLANLAVNARDAMPDGGILTVETANTQVDELVAAGYAGLEPGSYVSVKVSDTGTGIPRAVIDRVFEPFFTTKPKGEGSGLGLAIAYGIIQQSGGGIRLYSEEGLGTTVTMLLPATDIAAVNGESPVSGSRNGGGELVLVVEDETAMREVTRRILTRNGYQVLTAANGPEAIDLAVGHSGHIDVLLSDVIMPQMLGKEVAESVGALQPGIRVLFMSGYTQGVLGPQGVLDPGVSLLEKPFTESSLLDKLREVLAAPA